jgi:hypothetical protein
MSNSTDWILDSGASLYYYNDESQIRSYIPYRINIKVGKGTVTTVSNDEVMNRYE